jgi:hypothetical protein
MAPFVRDSGSYPSQRTPADRLAGPYKKRITYFERPENMITESELAEKIRSGTVLKAVAYPWGIEFEASDSSDMSRPEE